MIPITKDTQDIIIYEIDSSMMIGPEILVHDGASDLVRP